MPMIMFFYEKNHLVAVPLRTAELFIRDTINVSVFTAEIAITSPSDSTLRRRKMVYGL